MKKTILILLSLILLFSFVSCNGSTNSPSDSGSSTKPSINLPTAPVDTNVPPTSAFKDAETTGGNTKILSGIDKLRGKKPFVQKMEEKSTITYKIIDGAKWYDADSIEGTLKVKLNGKYDTNNIKTEYTLNGEVKKDKTTYTFDNFFYVYEEVPGAEYPTVNFSGAVKKNNTIVDNDKIKTENEYTDLYQIIRNLDYIASISNIQSATVDGGSYIEYDSSEAKGKFSSSKRVLSNSIVSEAIANFEKIVIENENHKITAKYKVTRPFEGEPTIEITYISFDDEYYKTESISEKIKIALLSLVNA